MELELKDVLSSECGFQHVPLDITRGKLKALVAGVRRARERVTITDGCCNARKPQLHRSPVRTR